MPDAAPSLVVGLGNPGREYEATPHNLGFRVVDRLAEQAGARIARPEARSLTAHTTLEGRPVVLAKPLTYMNLSGQAVRELLDKAEPAFWLVVSDELNLPLGTLRIRERGSAGGHHGLESIIEWVDSQDFVRVRMGVGPEHPLEDAADYLLRPFPRAREEQVEELVERAAEAVRTILRDGPAKAMNVFNRRPDNGPESDNVPDSSA